MIRDFLVFAHWNPRIRSFFMSQFPSFWFKNLFGSNYMIWRKSPMKPLDLPSRFSLTSFSFYWSGKTMGSFTLLLVMSSSS